LDSNAYIKLAPNGAVPVRRLPPALGTGAGPAVAGRAGALALRAGRGLRPCPALRFIVKKHLLIYDVHIYQRIDIHWRFFL